MAEGVPSQANFLGWLAIVLMGVAVLAAIVVLVASGSTPAVR